MSQNSIFFLKKLLLWMLGIVVDGFFFLKKKPNPFARMLSHQFSDRLQWRPLGGRGKCKWATPHGSLLPFWLWPVCICVSLHIAPWSCTGITEDLCSCVEMQLWCLLLRKIIKIPAKFSVVDWRVPKSSPTYPGMGAVQGASQLAWEMWHLPMVASHGANRKEVAVAPSETVVMGPGHGNAASTKSLTRSKEGRKSFLPRG